MKTLAKKSLLALTLGLCLAFVAGSASAQTCDPKDPKCEPPKEGTPCSPGYWKNHLDDFNQFCLIVEATTGTNCEDQLTALTCKGSDASCGRTAAATQLNLASGGCFE